MHPACAYYLHHVTFEWILDSSRHIQLMMGFLLDVYSNFCAVLAVLIMPPWINSEKFELQKKARPAQECLRAFCSCWCSRFLRFALLLNSVIIPNPPNVLGLR